MTWVMALYDLRGWLGVKSGGSGGGGFFLANEDFGGRFDESFPACAFFIVEISSRTPIPLF